MPSSQLYRASGLALFVGAPLFIIGDVLGVLLYSGNDPHQYLSPLFVVVTLVTLLGEVLLLIGFPGIVPRVGRLGFAGFILAFLGGFLSSSFSVVDLLVSPWLAQAAPSLAVAGPPAATTFFLVGSALFALGGILLAIAALRAGMLPRVAVAVLIIGVVLNLASTPLMGTIANILNIVAIVCIGLPFGWMGYALMSAQRMAPTQADPASALQRIG